MLSLSFVDFITILVIAPGAVSVQVGQQMITRVLNSGPLSPRRTNHTRKVNSSLSLCVFCMTALRWLIACADMARHKLTYAAACSAWRVELKQRNSTVPR